jgi:hypothetical protein
VNSLAIILQGTVEREQVKENDDCGKALKCVKKKKNNKK